MTSCCDLNKLGEINEARNNIPSSCANYILVNKFILNVKSNLNPAKDQYLYRKKALESKRKDTLEFVGGFSGGSDGKEPACNAGDLGLIPGSGRSPGERNGYPFQYPFLEKSMDREA